MKLTIEQIRKGLESLAQEYKETEGDLKRAEINSTAFTYISNNLLDNMLRLQLFRYYEKEKFDYDKVLEPVEYENL